MSTSCTISWWTESSVFNTSITLKSEHNTVKSILLFYAFCAFPHSTTVPIYYFTYFRSPKWYISTSVFFNSTSNKYEILESAFLLARTVNFYCLPFKKLSTKQKILFDTLKLFCFFFFLKFLTECPDVAQTETELNLRRFILFDSLLRSLNR